MQQPAMNFSEEDRPVWTEIKCGEMNHRENHTSTLYNNYTITFGGKNQEDVSNSVVVFNMNTFTWTEERPTGPVVSPRHSHTACLYKDNKIVIFGGQSDVAVLNETGVLTVSKTDRLAMEWKVVQTEGGDSFYRMGHTAHIYQDKMYVYGGKDQSGRPTNELWCLDLETLVWTQCQVTGEPCIARQYHCGAIYGNHLYIFGGVGNSIFQLRGMDVLSAINLETMSCKNVKMGGDVPSPRAFTNIQEKEGKLYTFGGFENTKRHNDMHVYDITENAWTKIETKNEAPSKRSDHSFIAYKNNFLVWGGVTSSTAPSLYVLALTPEEKVEVVAPQDPDVIKFSSDEYTKTMKQILRDTPYYDVTFTVEGHEFPAHRAIVASRCRYFENMFTSGMRESRARTIDVPGVKAETFKSLLEIIYTNELRTTPEVALDLFDLANKWCLSDIANQCELFLASHLTPENLVSVAKVADFHDSTILREGVISSIVAFSERLEESEDLYRIPPMFLMKALSKAKNQTCTI